MLVSLLILCLILCLVCAIISWMPLPAPAEPFRKIAYCIVCVIAIVWLADLGGFRHSLNLH